MLPAFELLSIMRSARSVLPTSLLFLSLSHRFAFPRYTEATPYSYGNEYYSTVSGRDLSATRSKHAQREREIEVIGPFSSADIQTIPRPFITTH